MVSVLFVYWSIKWSCLVWLDYSRDFYLSHYQESSAKLTHAFISSPFSIHVRHILPNSKFQHSYSGILLIFYTSEQHVWKLWVWVQFTGLTLPLWGTPVNNRITLISPVQWGLHFLPLTVCVALQISEQFSPKARTPTHWIELWLYNSKRNEHE